MKITVLTSSYPRFAGDGAAPFIKSISEALARLGNQVEVVAPFDPAVIPGEQGTLPVHRFRYVWPDRWSIMGHARSLEADAHLRPLSYLLLPLFLASAFFKLFAVSKRQHAQAIYCHWVIPNGPAAVCVAGLRKIPLIVSLHGSDIYLARKNKLFGRVAHWVFRHAAAVTACSDELRQGALELGAPADTLLLPWGADPQIFNPERRNPGFRSEMNSEPDNILLLTMGRMVHKKGFNVLLDTLPDLLDQNSKIRVVMAGDGPLREAYQQRVAGLGLSDKVFFPGQIPWDRAPDLLAAADIFILPSIKDEYGNIDGLPTVLLEAMASGTAIIASDIAGVRLVIDPGQNGWLVEPGKPEYLRQAIQTLADDSVKRQILARAARRSIVEHYNWEWVARQITGLLEQAVWRRRHKLRLGTAYRDEMVRILGYRPTSGRILDVGCHDGYWLSTLSGGQKIGVDPQPTDVNPHVDVVCADGVALPFADQSFDWVFAMDVIEHVEDDDAFARSLSRMVASGGRLFLSTPSLDIRLTPRCLTRWISHQWGHYLRLGYTPERLKELFQDELEIKIQYWNAPAYRFYYLPVRLLSMIAPRFIARFVQRQARADAKKTGGPHGFVILEGTRSPSANHLNNPDET
jgi:glycosyltransferase involved in cell wall biosynthesis/ubiquinone/menaquinone biosynthesis C-methylase UbiE